MEERRLEKYVFFVGYFIGEIKVQARGGREGHTIIHNLNEFFNFHPVPSYTNARCKWRERKMSLRISVDNRLNEERWM